MKLSQTLKNRRFLAAFVLGFLLFTIPLTGRWFKLHQISRELDVITARGEPTTFTDVLEFYGQPSAQVTTVWTQAFEQLEIVPEENLKTMEFIPYLGFADEPLDGRWQNIKYTEDYLKNRSQARELLYRAATLGGESRYPIDAQDGFDGLTYPDGLLDSYRLLDLETHYYAFKKNAPQTARAISCRLALAGSLRKYPSSTSQILRRSFDVLTAKDIARYMSVLSFSDDTLRQFQFVIRQSNNGEELVHQLLVLRAAGISLFQDPLAADAQINAYNSFVTSPFYEFTKQLGDPRPRLKKVQYHEELIGWFNRPEDFLVFLNTIRDLLATSKMEWPDAIKMATEVERQLETKTAPGLLGRPSLLTGMLVHSPTDLFTDVARTMARNRVYDVAIAIELYRRLYGRLPDSLDALVPNYLPEVFVDPFSGDPVRFVYGDKKVVVYSVGNDGIDDGGDGGEGGFEPDITWVLDLSYSN